MTEIFSAGIQKADKGMKANSIYNPREKSNETYSNSGVPPRWRLSTFKLPSESLLQEAFKLKTLKLKNLKLRGNCLVRLKVACYQTTRVQTEGDNTD